MTGSTTTHTLSVLVEDKPGVLARVAALFSRRGFNIESLAVGATEQKDMSRMTIVVSAESTPLEQITKQLNKLINVIKILEQDDDKSVSRELALIKVRADAGTRSQVIEAVNLFRGKVIGCGVTGPGPARHRYRQITSQFEKSDQKPNKARTKEGTFTWLWRCSTTMMRTCRSFRAARSASSGTAARDTHTH